MFLFVCENGLFRLYFAPILVFPFASNVVEVSPPHLGQLQVSFSTLDRKPSVFFPNSPGKLPLCRYFWTNNSTGRVLSAVRSHPGRTPCFVAAVARLESLILKAVAEDAVDDEAKQSVLP